MSDETKNTETKSADEVPEIPQKKEEGGFKEYLDKMDPLARVALIMHARHLYKSYWDKMQAARAAGDISAMTEAGSICWLVLAGVEYFLNDGDGTVEIKIDLPTKDPARVPDCFRPVGGKN